MQLFRSQLENLSRHDALQKAREEYETTLRLVQGWTIMQHNLAGTVNQLAPINALPDTILISIFAILEEQSLFRSSRRHAHALRWVKVLDVCRRWRAVAIAAPELWTVHLSLYRTKWLTETASRRSSGDNLRVYWNTSINHRRDVVTGEVRHGYTADWGRLYRVMEESLAHATQFFLSEPLDTDSGDLLRRLYMLNTPHLKVLHVKNRSLDGSIRNASAAHWSFRMQHLEELHLAGVVVNLRDITTGSKLRFLELRRQHQKRTNHSDAVWDSGLRDDLAAFLDFLKSTPQLESLIVCDAGPSVTSLPPHLEPCEPRIELLALAHLKLSGTTNAYCLLPHLWVPACVRADIEFFKRSESPPVAIGVPFIFPRESHFWRSWEGSCDVPPLHTLSFNARRRVALKMKFLFRANGDEDRPSGRYKRRRQLILRVREEMVHTKPDRELEADMVSVTHDVFPSSMASVKEFYVHQLARVGEPMSKDVWEVLLPSMPRLRILGLSAAGPTVSSALHALHSQLSTGSEADCTVCPDLRTVFIPAGQTRADEVDAFLAIRKSIDHTVALEEYGMRTRMLRSRSNT